MTSDPGDQLVDHVDRDDRVLGTVTRAELRAGNLRHRAVYIVVRTTSGGVVAHRRADWKDVHPGAWDVCFGGVLASGEDWDEAAARELAEEAGIEAPLTFERAALWIGDDTEVVGRVYSCVHDGPYPCPDGEVVEVRAIRLPDVADFLAQHPHCPDSVELAAPLLGLP